VTFGGGQERGLRPGTLPTHQIIGFGAACELAGWSLGVEPRVIEQLRDRLWSGLSRLDGVHLNGQGAPRLPGILNVSFEGVEGESLVTGLSALAVTTGSACSSASGDPSYVLRALGRNTQLAQASLRFSLGRATTEGDIDVAIDAVRRQVMRLRAVSPSGSGSLGALGAGGDVLRAGFEGAVRGSERRAQGADSAGAFGEAEALLTARVPDVVGSFAAAGSFGAGSSLSPLTHRYFEALPGAGVLPAGPGVIHGNAGGPEHEAWVRFHLRVEQGTVKAALFQAWGCPHTLAVTAWLTGQLPGRSMTDLVPGTPSAWLQALEVPVEKLGRLLVVEDALRAAYHEWGQAP
jgi:NifU-like protein involved in Fe-S cluster formation